MLLLLTGCRLETSGYTLTLGGDIMLARAGQVIFNQVNPWQQLEAAGIFSQSKTPDYFMANLESPLGEPVADAGKMNLCSDAESAEVLKEGDITLMTLVNNHRDDCGEGGAAVTQKLLAEQGILSVTQDDPPVIIDTPDGKLAILAAEDVTGALDMEKLLAGVRSARSQAQFVVVSMHWGVEYQAGPTARQQELAQLLADAGADVVWGQHPHVLQHMEWLTATDGRQTLVIYSLGNLLADQWMLEDAQRSALIRLHVAQGKIEGIEVIPLVMDRSTLALMLSTDTEYWSSRLQLDSLERDEVKINFLR